MSPPSDAPDDRDPLDTSGGDNSGGGGQGKTGADDKTNRRAKSEPSAKPAPTAPGASRLPTREQILEFLSTADQKAGKREIARAFGIRGGGDKIELKRLLKEMAADGVIAGNRREFRQPGQMPPVTVIDVLGRDQDGELYAEPVTWDRDVAGAPPRILIVDSGGKRRGTPAGVGDRLLAKITATDNEPPDYGFEARPIKRLAKVDRRMLGIFREGARGGVIEPIDRKQMKDWPVDPHDTGDAKTGDLVRFTVVGRNRSGVQRARIAESLGNPKDQRQISLIAVHALGIPDEFPAATLEQLDDLPPLYEPGDTRTDLTSVPLITIDPADARDHDDAVWAGPDTNTANPGGFVVVVAIADVAHYVRPGTPLDTSALERGNSVYFPDRVVPMLPEKISNDLCSLRENEVRPCLAVRLTYAADGTKRGHKFERGLMRSHVKLAYEEAQAAIDGRPSPKAEPWLEPVLRPLWDAYETLARKRDERAPLALDLPERRIVMNAEGSVAEVISPERLDAHRLIETFMIEANVAAAETLESKKSPLIYRAHDQPSREKLEALRNVLETMDLKLPKGETLKPGHFNRVLADVVGRDVEPLVNEVVLRSQSQAEYTPKNYGHFGLNLQRYAHFTSPIRRYADLIVHRALIRSLGLEDTATGRASYGDDSLTDHEIPRLDEIATQISETERRAMSAERETSDRLIAAFLVDRVGAQFRAKISGVTRSGLFVRLDDTGADGFIPASTLGDDYFRHDEAAHAMVGDRSGLALRLGDKVEVRLIEAVPTAGALRFEMLSEGQKLKLSDRASSRRSSGRGRPSPPPRRPKRRPGGRR